MEVPKELREKYIVRRSEDLEACRALIKRGMYPEIEKIGHKLKGNGKTFGHPELSEIGKALESAAIQRDLFDLRRAIDQFSGWVHGQN